MRLVLIFAACLSAFISPAYASGQMFSIGGELAKLDIPDGWCVLNGAETSFAHVPKEQMGQNDVLAVFVPCYLMEDGKLNKAPDVWAMWIAQRRQVQPATATRKQFLAAMKEGLKASTEGRVLGVDDRALYTSMDIAGESDAISAVIALTKINNHPVTLNLYKTHTSDSSVNLLSMAQFIIRSTLKD